MFLMSRHIPWLPLRGVTSAIRLQIWETELRRPNFIEVQLHSGIWGAGFEGASTRLWSSALQGVCRESRNVAIAFAALEEGEKVHFWIRDGQG